MAPPKGTPKPAGSGRKKGVPNKTTQLLKDAVLRAAQIQGNRLATNGEVPKGTKDDRRTGLEHYLVWLADKEPVAFTGLLNKVLPMQVGGVSDDGEGLNIFIRFE